MALTALILGLAIGWLVCWLSERLPFVGKSQTNPPTSTALRWLTPGVMVGTAVLYSYLWHLLQFSSNFFFLATLCAFLILIAVIDLKYRLILNVLIVPAILLMLLYQFVPLTRASWFALFGGIAAFLLFLLVAFLRPGGLGGGDLKLAAFLGVTFGLPYVFWALLAGVLVGGATAVFLLVAKHWRLSIQIPYGPFLCFGAIIALLLNPLPWLFSLFS